MNRRLSTAITLVATVAALGVVPAAIAHEVRPGYLELRQIDAETFDVLWKVPARGDRRFGIRPELPPGCTPVAASRESWTGDAYVERSTVRCAGGLDGRRLTIAGLTATVIDVLVRVVRTDGSVQVARLLPSAPTLVVEAAPGQLGVALTYLRLGVEHILLGFDHLLFVLALVMLVGTTRRLVTTVTAFTVAHSVTLGAATLGFVHVPQRPVEAIIALSIMFVAAEIVHGAAGRPGATARRPWAVALIFGLLHGFGFAGALSDVGLPSQAIPVALLFFNLGVEIGQLAFIAAMLGIIALARRVPIAWPAWAWRLPPYAIGAVAAYWTIERVARF